MTEPSIASRTKSLVESLASRDLLERQAYLSEIAGLGDEAIPVILDDNSDLTHAETALREVIRGLPDANRERACTHLVRTLRRDRRVEVRLIAITLLGDLLPDLSGYIDRAIEISLDASESSELRTLALRALRSAALDATHMSELGKLLHVDILGSSCPVPLREAAFRCFEAHAAKIAVETTMNRLDPFLTHPDPSIRGHALALLGDIGDIDAIERMCMLPNTQEEIELIQKSIGRILQRPANLLSLRWEHFEQFVAHLLRKMGHENVETTRPVGDDGVDVVSYKHRDNLKGPARERWIVQCKRWTTKNVDVVDLEKLIVTTREKDGKHALLITTSGFTHRAIEFGKRNEAMIELVTGNELLRILDQHFGSGRYTIRVRE